MNRQYAIVATFGRLLIATIFLVSGLGKIASPQMTQGYIASAGLPFPLIKNIAITGGLLQVVAFGGGSFSIDGRLNNPPGVSQLNSIPASA